MDLCVYYLERLGLFINIGTWSVSSLECLASCFVLVAYFGLAPSLSRVLPVSSRDCVQEVKVLSQYFFFLMLNLWYSFMSVKAALKFWQKLNPCVTGACCHAFLEDEMSL
jgi:hypothetical protein